MNDLDDSIAAARLCGDAMARVLEHGPLDDRDFAVAATEVLGGSTGIGEIGLPAIAAFLARRDAPTQSEWRFSDIPVVIYQHPQFYIELLHWVEATTSIHEHSFAGAFRVISGSSLHSRYRLDERRKLVRHVEACTPRFLGSEHLVRGDVRTIEPGSDGLVHSLYHLDTPSVSLVLRTNGRSSDQYSLQRPRIWWNEAGLSSDQRTNTLLRTIRLAEGLRHGDGQALLRSVASAVDHCQWTYLIMRCPELFAGHADLADLLGARAETPDELNAELSASFQSLLVEQQIISARRSIRDPDLRFLLALLLNIADRAEILRLVAAYAGSDDPVNAVAGWVVRLALYRGDPRERLARLAVAAAADHRIGVNLRALLPADLTHEDMQALLERALCVVPDADPAIQRTRGALATHPVFRALLPVASN